MSFFLCSSNVIWLFWQLTLPPEYPNASPPIFEIDAHWLRGVRRTQLEAHLEETYL